MNKFAFVKCKNISVIVFQLNRKVPQKNVRVEKGLKRKLKKSKKLPFSYFSFSTEI